MRRKGQVTIQLALNDQKRVVPFQRNPSYTELHNYAKALYSAFALNDFVFTYIDEDGDRIAVTSDLELEESISHLTRHVASKNKMVALRIAPVGDSAPLPACDETELTFEDSTNEPTNTNYMQAQTAFLKQLEAYLNTTEPPITRLQFKHQVANAMETWQLTPDSLFEDVKELLANGPLEITNPKRVAKRLRRLRRGLRKHRERVTTSEEDEEIQQLMASFEVMYPDFAGSSGIPKKYSKGIHQLNAMGFSDNQLNLAMLHKYRRNVRKVVNAYVEE
mmetsp:Transcript_20162/g.22427  ORF Transcript_20162/g.22427 Transcript_20162/m.22427 type:complete len:277 (+) Transcript_20162:22-852(+)